MAEFKMSVFTNKGTRDHNEDSCGYRADEGKVCFVVADGLGGHEKGEVASQIAVEYVLKHFTDNDKFTEENLLELLYDTDRAVKEEQKEHPGMRTTVAAAFIQDGKFWYFHVGDTRCYYLKNGCIYEQSKDHSIPQIEVSMGEIKTEDIRFHVDRNRLLKVLGNEDELLIEHLEQPIDMESGDAFLLCTDGFWEYVYETEMEVDFLKSSSPKEWNEHMIKRLLNRPASEHDNYTVMSCWI